MQIWIFKREYKLAAIDTMKLYMMYFNNYVIKLKQRKEVGGFAKLTNWLSSMKALVAGSAPLQAQALTKNKVSDSGSISSQSHVWWAASDPSCSEWVPTLSPGTSLLAHSLAMEIEFLLFLPRLLGLKPSLVLNLIAFCLKNFLGSPHCLLGTAPSSQLPAVPCPCVASLHCS